jgi:hypothetical protein
MSLSLSSSSGKKKSCPKHQILTRVCQNRCVNQTTFNEKVAEKLKYNNKRSSRRKSSSSKSYYTAKQFPSYSSSRIRKDIENMMKKMKSPRRRRSRSPSPRRRRSRSPRRTPEKMKKGLLSASLLQSIRKPSNQLKKVNRSPRKNLLLSQIKQGIQLKKVNRSPRKNLLLSQIKQGIQLKSFEKTKKTLPSLPMNIKELQYAKNKLKKTNNAVKTKSPEKSFVGQALMKKFENIRSPRRSNKKKSSSDSDNYWSS